MSAFKRGDVVYWWGERCEVLDGPKWPVANPEVPPEFEVPDGRDPGPRHYLYGDKPDRRTTEWRERNPAWLVRRSNGRNQYILEHGLTKDRKAAQRKANFLATVVEMYTLLSQFLSREEHSHFLKLADRDARKARAYLTKKKVPAKCISQAMQLSLKIRQ